MKTVELTFELPQDVFSVLRQESAQFLDAMRLAAAVKWYEMGQVSQSKAAELASVSRADLSNAAKTVQLDCVRIVC